jgi:hypothetical protein
MIALVASVAEAPAHEIPARRQVVAQADADRAMFLVTWASARGPQGSQLIARALWGRRGDRRQVAVEALASREALSGLEILADGVAVKPSSIEVKVRIDARQPARLVAAVLVTVDRDGARTITVRNRSAVSTRLMWTSPGRAATGPDQPRAWLPGRRTLTLTWTRPDVSQASMRPRRD